MRSSTIPDRFGLYWDIPSFLVDWTNRLILMEEQGPDWRFSAVLASFHSLPGELTDLLRLDLHVENRGDSLEVTVQGGQWLPAGASHPLGRRALYGSTLKALIWLSGWRSMATGKMIRVLGLAENAVAPLLDDSWLNGDLTPVEVASRTTSI